MFELALWFPEIRCVSCRVNILFWNHKEKITTSHLASFFFALKVRGIVFHILHGHEWQRARSAELIHLFVEILDGYFKNVCELDLVFQFDKVYFILDELILGGEISETARKSILDNLQRVDKMDWAQGEDTHQKKNSRNQSE